MPEPGLAALNLPGAWAAQRQFALLDIGPATWHPFLATWQAWLDDPQRPAQLHYVVASSHLPPHPTTLPFDSALTTPLDAALWGLLPGFHRLAFQGGQVLLTVCVGGDVIKLLRELSFAADAVWVNAHADTDLADVYGLKAIARCCRRGTHVAGSAAGVQRDLQVFAQCGFAITADAHGWRGTFNPRWATPSNRLPHSRADVSAPATCTVIGAGLAGAAVAASLARRGWRVTVLDAADAPASGASSLPAGLMAAHVSPDDSPLSRLSRAGIRMTLQQAAALLEVGQDYSPAGVLERCLAHARRRPASWQTGGVHAAPAADWVTPASPAQLAACGLTLAHGEALWHAKAGWVKPAALVNAWLTTPGVTWRGRCNVASVQRAGALWQVNSPAGEVLALSDLVVVAAGQATAALLKGHSPGSAHALPLQPIRGQVSWGWHDETDLTDAPDFPVNGHGHLLAGIPMSPDGARTAWLIGASYERDVSTAHIKPADDAYNLARLHQLLPTIAHCLQAEATALHAWSGVRCATPTRLPWVGPVKGESGESGDSGDSGLWVCTGMGSRGLTFAALCAELLAAQLHGEPWPIERRLAAALAPAGLRSAN